MVRFDYTNLALTPLSSSTSLSITGWGRSTLIFNMGGNVLTGGEFNNHVVLNKASLAVVYGSVSNAFGGFTSNTYTSVIDNLNAQVLYSTSGTGNIFKRGLSSMIAGTASFDNLASYELGSGYSSYTYALRNMGTYQYLAVGGRTFFWVFDKNTFQLVSTATYQNNLSTIIATMLGYMNGARFYFGKIEAGNYNFQSYYLLFDNCTYRGTDDVCTTCLPGYYRTSLTAACECILPADFLPKYGADTPNLLMAACSTGCLTCSGNYLQCDLCDKPAGYHLNTTDSRCYLKSNLGVGRGAKQASSVSAIVLNCVADRCTNCTDDYAVCKACNTADLYYLLETDGLCY